MVAFVITSNEACSVGVGLSRLDGADKTAVGYVFVPFLPDVSIMDEVYGVCAFDPIPTS